MSRSFALAVALVAVVAFAFASTAGARPAAHAARSCSPPKYPGQGYFTSLQVSHVGCATGRKVTLAHYRCRIKHGRKGHCARVLHYRCSETRRAIPTEYTSRVTCTRGARKVVYTYEQFLD
jgi:hypothetical protein